MINFINLCKNCVKYEKDKMILHLALSYLHNPILIV